MAQTASFIAAVPADRLKVWVLAPSLQTQDANIDYYYDFSQSIDEYTKVFSELGIDWQWQPVTMNDYTQVINMIAEERASGITEPVVLNLCDGDEVNGTPGISVVRMLQEKGLVYTGSDEYFYQITTSKIPMKQAFDKAGVPTARWEAIQAADQPVKGIFERLGTPIIVKPAVSGGSMGVGVKNVVFTEEELVSLIKEMFEGYRGWNLAADGLIAEEFITGSEFTTMIVGSSNHARHCKVLEPVERVFHESLPEHEKFLSFDRLWEIYEDETPMPEQQNFYEYREADKSLNQSLRQISLDAYLSVKGKGYTRIDLRMDAGTGKIYVLEVNAQCGISEDEDYTSIGAILRFSDMSFTDLVTEIINDAYRRKIKKPVIIKEISAAPVVPLREARTQRKKIQ